MSTTSSTPTTFDAATPGPWEYDERTGRIVKAGTKEEIFHLCDDATYAANKRLQAAAPSLLSVLKAIVRDLPHKRDWLDPDLEREARELTGVKRVDWHHPD